MTEDLDKLQTIVTRHIPREWRSDIEVDSVDRLKEDNGRPAGTVFVRISARTKLGKAQAMLSIGPYVTNEPREWSTGWSRSDDGGWMFTAYGPSAEPQQPTIAEAVDQAESRASASS